ncbi:unnamed protein product [Colletotrichum noveboracense]|uniref:Uncharacterized protein n=3 Tax=Colletotrichum gloeosporioides species complex TaxID=2707338 RepID=A0A9W4RJX7_9PEZI|nr:hypothetical protein K456DRAFT_1729275 [Colletotrichum gloeosporioides 23]CAI0642506.1 unnamed protein product [Colletotrichum noveboracense]
MTLGLPFSFKISENPVQYTHHVVCHLQHLPPSANSCFLSQRIFNIIMGLPLKLGVPNVPEESSSQQQSSQPAAARSQEASQAATGAGANIGAGTTRPKTEAELEADRLYEEAMEEEYAKRDGGS